VNGVTRVRATLGRTLAAVGLAALMTAAPARAGVGEAALVAPGAGEISVSADGSVVAFSTTDALVPEDRNGNRDVYVGVRDGASTSFRLISHLPSGQSADYSSRGPEISADGSTVAFISRSDSLVDGDGNGREDVFAASANGEGIERVNLGPGGAEADGLSALPDARPSLSADGSQVAFSDTARLTEDAVMTIEGNVYVRDRGGDATRFIAEGSAAAISGDGKVVAYQRGDQVYASTPDRTELVSRPPEGEKGDAASERPDVNEDGSRIAFASFAANLVAGDEGKANAGEDVFVRDRGAQRTELVSRDDRSRPALGSFSQPSISGDGGIVAFLAGADPNGCGDPALGTVAVRDIDRESTYSAGRALPGQLPDGIVGFPGAGGPSVAAEGGHAGYASDAANLVDRDDNAHADGFVSELGALEDPIVFSPVREARAAEADGALDFELGICRPAGRRVAGELTYATEAGTAGSGTDYVATGEGVAGFGADEARLKVGVPLVDDGKPERCETLFLRAREGSAMLPARGAGVIEGDDAAGGPVYFQRGGDILSVQPCGEPVHVAEGREPAMSPDGERLAFVRAGSDGDELVVSGADGTGAEVVAHGGAGRFGRPAWSPDGKVIAVGEADGNPEEPHVQVLLVAADGGGAKPAGDPISFAGVTLSFSPDGKRLAFDRARIGSEGGPLVTILDLDTGEIESLGRGGVAPSFGPDGSLVYVRNDVMKILAPDGDDEREFIPKVSGELRPERPAFSPDGTGIVFVRKEDATSWIETAPVAGGDARALTTPRTFVDRNPAWGPGGPVITLPPAVSVADTSATEGSELDFAVTLSSPAADPVTVTASTSGGSAQSGTDFTAKSEPVTIPAGSTAASLKVPTTQDALDEPDETMTVTLSDPSGATIADGTATGTIVDDDPTPSVTIGDASASEGDPVGFPITLSAASSRSVTVRLTTSNGTAAAPGDYTAQNDVLVTVPAGQTQVTASVPTTEDAANEPTETFTATISAAANAVLGAETVASGTIFDDDPLPPPTVSIGTPAPVDEGAPLQFPVTISRVPNVNVSVLLTTVDGTAVAPDDYTARIQQSITIPAGQTQAFFEVQTVDDVLVEGDETMRVEIRGGTGALLGSPSSATGTIRSTDLPPPTVSIGTPAPVDEGAPLRFPVTISRPHNVNASVRLSTSDGTAVAPDDYTARIQQDITIPAGQTQAFFEVQTVDDVLVEGDETVTVSIRGGTNVSLGSPSSATGTIRSTDLPPPAVSIGTPAVVDEGTQLRFPVTISRPHNVNASVRLSTSDGTAKAPDDYTARIQQDITIPAGQTQGTFTVDTVRDSITESDETVTVSIRGGTNVSLGSPSSATGTIRDPTPRQIVRGATLGAQVLSGDVSVRLPKTKVPVDLGRGAMLPVGTVVDATKGTIELVSAVATAKVRLSAAKTQRARFSGGVFTIRQKRGSALVTLVLSGRELRRCPKAAVRRLQGDGKGAFAVQGRFAAATVRSGRWLTEDRCRATTVKLQRGSAKVRDLVRKRTRTVRAGRSLTIRKG
jgi:Tol biopolymer transport system component